MKCVSVCILAAAAAMLCAGVARAQSASPNLVLDPAKPSGPAPARPATFAPSSAVSSKRLTPEQRDEWRFLKDAAAASRLEAEASRMALTKSNDSAVRSLAATLVNHNGTAGPVLQHMLHVRSMAPPMLSNDQRKTLNRLSKLQGLKFDRAYMEEVALKNQQEGVQSFQKASAIAGDPALKAWIDRTLPTLRYQLATAERVMASNARLGKVGASSSAAEQGTSSRVGSRGGPTAHSSGPAPASGGSLGAGNPGNMQLGPTRPIAARPIESSNR